MKYSIRLLIVIILLSTRLYPQKDDVKFEHLYEGLSQNSVLCMSQDNQGFMWFGTYDGLNKYDGYTFKIYKSESGNYSSLSNNTVQSILEDHSGVLWIGTEGGLDKFDREKDGFIHFRNDPNDPNSLSSNRVQCICEDKTGVLWIGTFGGGLNQFDKERKRFIRYRNNPADPYSISSNNILSVYLDKSGNPWVATENGVNYYDRLKNRFIRYQHDPKNPHSLSRNNAYRVFEDKSGVVWIGLWGGGLDKFDRKKKQFIHYRNRPGDPYSLSNDVVRSIYEDEIGRLWIGTWGGGVDQFDRKNNRFIQHQANQNDPSSLSNNSVLSIYEDRLGILWVGTDYGGINKFDREKIKFVHYQKEPNNSNSLSNNTIYSISETIEKGKKIIWIGTQGGGLTKFDKARNLFKHYRSEPNKSQSLNDNFIRAIIEDRSGALWIGTTTGGLNQIDRVNGTFTHYVHDPNNPNSLSNDDIFCINEDRLGYLWIGTWGGGINKFDPRTKKFTRYIADQKNSYSLSDNLVWSIFEDRDGFLWIGTEYGGLNRFDRDKNQFIHYKADPENPNGLSSNKILCIYEDVSGMLWLGTTNGLNSFDRINKKFSHYIEADGLPSKTIQSILEDKHGNLWLGTQKGLSKFNPQTGRFKNFKVSEGLQSNEFSVNACFKSQNDEMYFGGINGFNTFFPDSIKDNLYIPSIVVVDFRIFNKSVPIGKEMNGRIILEKSITETKEIKLSYKENVFSFEFAALNLTSPGDNKYAYMMEGFDTTWNYTDADKRFATYTNIGGGEYVFRAIGSNSDGVWNHEGVSIHVIITPPFWQTLWFKFFLLTIFAGSIFWIYKWREIISKQRELEELAKSERKYRSLFENSLAGMVRFSLETWDILNTNEAMKQIFGCVSEQEIAGCFSRLPAHSIQDIQRSLLSSDIIQEYEIRTTRLDARELWILFSAKMTGKEHFAHGVIVDITERKVSAEKISEQAMLLDKSQDAIMVTDYQGRITFWNSGAELIYGWKREQAVGSFIRDLIFDKAHSKDYNLAMEDILHFDEWIGEQYHLNREGKELIVQSRWKKVESASINKKIILIVNTDITEKKRQEIRLLRAQRMESIALLTGGIAHDLQNVLAPVSMSIDLLREKLTDDPSIKVLDAVEESARSGMELIRNIITYGHGIPGERVKIEISGLIESVLMIVKQSLPDAIKIEKLIEVENSAVLGDANQLKQVFLNIVVNARDAMPDGGILTIGIDRVAIDENSLDSYPEAKIGTYYMVSIRDNGSGISEDCIERIFEPFFTTKTNGSGTGLGLSIALGIVKSHSGFIAVQSVINQGTEFKIYLPVLKS